MPRAACGAASGAPSPSDAVCARDAAEPVRYDAAMLARERLRQDTDAVLRSLAARGDSGAALRELLALDEERRRILQEVEELKRQRNEASKLIGQRKSKGEDASAEIAAVSRLKSDVDRLESRLAQVDAELQRVELGLPNLPHASVPVGADSEANRVERTVGAPPRFAFEPKAHWDLGPALGILDFERGAKLAGSRFTTYFGAGARLERALAQLMLDLHSREHGYLEVWPPLLVSRETMVGSGQLPKFEADAFRIESADLFLVPTAEVPLCNLHRDEVLAESALPLRYVAWTPCFRAEAGSHGRDVRGLIRQHQFHKVELVQYAHPAKSYEAHEELTGHAERVLRTLELPYRVVTLSTGDMGFASAKTYDLEVWLPGQGEYREISSCSNCEDFQARRANLRFRPEGGGKPQFVHTLNGSGLAVGRTLIAVLENYQQADGTVVVPEALRPYLGGLERIEPREPVASGVSACSGTNPTSAQLSNTSSAEGWLSGRKQRSWPQPEERRTRGFVSAASPRRRRQSSRSPFQGACSGTNPTSRLAEAASTVVAVALRPWRAPAQERIPPPRSSAILPPRRGG